MRCCHRNGITLSTYKLCDFNINQTIQISPFFIMLQAILRAGVLPPRRDMGPDAEKGSKSRDWGTTLKRRGTRG